MSVSKNIPKVEQVWTKLLKEIENNVSNSKRFAIGYNVNLDVVLPAVDFFNKYIEMNNLDISTLEAKDCKEITTIEDLISVFKFHFKDGRAAERFVTDSKLYKKLTTFFIENIDHKFLLGGNAGLMANSLSENGIPVLLAGIKGPILEKLIHKKVEFPKCEFVGEETKKENQQKLIKWYIENGIEFGENSDQIHLILEYKEGSSFGGLTAGRTNRFIISNDYFNAKMKTMKLFKSQITSYQPTDIVVTGIHLGDGLEKQDRLQLVDQFADNIKTLDPEIPLHFEFASVANLGFLEKIVNKVLPLIDSVGINEQELSSIAISLGKYSNEEIESIRNSSPPIKLISQVMYDTFSKFENTKLSRIHFHCLGYHMIGQNPDIWEDSYNAVAAGSLKASTQASGFTLEEAIEMDNFATEKLEFNERSWKLDQVNWNNDGIMRDFNIENIKFFWAPVAPCKIPIKTVGLGDAISITGFMNSNKKKKKN
ncbi:adp-dependent glucokinase [Anaeramoeba flamelloides]|uniref:Adp-dependent glucokinase n=1 Tax=Anaeramoeba flamelloides TaxID=1746091 RepID=A0ABQ8ZF43_9EUKA|nr:adp-dependent glucokinase [Anaeramoeba flamelloides]